MLSAIESDDPTALIGLPLIRTCELLRQAGIDPLRRCCIMTAAPGQLLLVPNTLDLGAPSRCEVQQVLPLGVLQRAASLAHWLAEDARSTRAFLKRVHAVVPLTQPLQAIDIRELPRPPKGGAAAAPAGDGVWRALLAPALAGQDIGLISEAGLPAVADPGAALVAAAHALVDHRAAAARRQFADAGAGGQRPERPELCLRRLPAPGCRPTRWPA